METQWDLNCQVQIWAIFERLQDHRTIDIALADRDKVIAVDARLNVLQMDMPAPRQSEHRIFCGINPPRSMGYGVSSVVIQPDEGRTNLFQEAEPILRQIEQVFLSISRVFQPDDH